MDNLDTLFRLLRDHGFRKDSVHPARLASGKVSPYYFDCKPVLLRREGARAFAEWILSHLGDLPERPTAIGGLEVGAITIAPVVVTLSSPPLAAFFVRKQPKGHGLRKTVEGALEAGETVAIVDDCITSGESTLKAIETVREMGCKVAGVFCLVDRDVDRSGDDGVEDCLAGYRDRFFAAFKMSDFLARLGS